MIKAIIFDIGGVLLRTQDHSYRQKWEAKLGLPPGGAEKLVLNSPMGKRAQLGNITTNELWAWVGDELELSPLERQAFRHDFWAGDVLDAELVALIRRLHERYQTAVISNYSDILHPMLLNDFSLGDAFDIIVGSSVEKIMKPDPQIYRIALERLGRQPQEAVFIDDFAHNIAGAAAVGLHGIHFTPHTNLQSELAQLGVKLEG